MDDFAGFCVCEVLCFRIVWLRKIDLGGRAGMMGWEEKEVWRHWSQEEEEEVGRVSD